MKKIVVCSEKFGDLDDLDLYIENALNQWEHSVLGQFVSKYGSNTSIIQTYDHSSYGHKLVITTEFDDKKLLEFYLRFDKIAA